MSKELVWRRKRVGNITASELNEIFSASGKIVDGNIDYIRRKRFERKRGFRYPSYSKNFDIGHEQEKYAFEWFKANYPDIAMVYSLDNDLPEIPFWNVGWANFGASPDGYAANEGIVLEIKTVVSNQNTEYYSDELTSFEDKMATVRKEHGYQIAGLFLSNEAVKEVWLLKYMYQHDDCDEDISSPLDAWRGIVFKLRREDFDLEKIKERICLFDAFIDSAFESKAIKSGDYVLKDGVIEEKV